jgi:RNA polymerase sigma-B factor
MPSEVISSQATREVSTRPGEQRSRIHRDDDYGRFAPLFERLADSGTGAEERSRLRDELILGHLPVAEHIAQRFRNRGQPEDDLRQVAVIGLVGAVDRFDPGRGSDFLSFAVPTITGELRRHFRDATWAVRVPRRLQELHSALAAATDRLYRKLNRAPRPSELAAELGVSLEEVQEGLQAGHAYNSVPLDSPAGPDDEPRGGTDRYLRTEDDNLAAVENRHVLYPALAALPEREASIVRMRFFENLTQSQIAERVGLSQMHVSRLLRASLTTMRRHLIADPD